MTGTACRALTSRGSACLNPARDGAFCTLHTGRNRCRGYTAKGVPCKARATGSTGFCPSHA